MKTTSVARLLGGAFFLAGGALSEDCVSVALKEIPSCALSCFIEGAPSVGCGGLDFACQCQNQAPFFAAIEGCVASSCEDSEYEKVIDGAAVVCECALGAPEVPVIVSGTVVPPSVTVLPYASGTIVPAPPTTVIPNPPDSGTGTGTGKPPVTAGADRQSGLKLGLVLSAACAVLAFAAL